jgi:hydrogenase nickel incorporation protein HypA/HybF
MHELGITSSVIATCAARAAELGAATRVTQVTLEVGKLAAVMPDALRFCFDCCAMGTPVEGAELEIIEIAGRARCRGCSAEQAVTQLFGRCACGGFDLEIVAGEELRIRQMEVTECAQYADAPTRPM